MDPAPDGALFWNLVKGIGSFVVLAFASWCVGEGGEILGAKYDASIIGGLLIAWLNTGSFPEIFISYLFASFFNNWSYNCNSS